ncbi:thymidine kinase [human gammaherpesvirus 4]|uniref:Thymidine kinase n=1 Tax=Epstein-Barr virus (strain GD1) TaxID=10376 RepID=A0A0B6VQ04_EBVG|nr:thymidine kinase [human gammaherpesvirus 4]
MAGFPGKEAGPPGGWRKCQEDESPENERHENFYAEIDDFAPSVLTPTGSDSGAGEEDDDGLYQVPTHWPPLMAPTGLSGERVPCRTQAAVTSNTGNSPGSRHTSCPFTLPRGAQPPAPAHQKPTAVFGDLTIVVPEPMRYWTHVYENAIKAMHKNVTRARHGREDTSAEVLACQMKFTTPFRVLASRKRSLLVTESGARSVAPLDCWILHDRHLLSASVVFPLMLLRSQLLSYSDFIQVLATFTADPGDTIVWMKLNVEENMRRLKKRGRKHESGLDAGYLKSVNDAYHAVYCAWLLTQYFAPEDIVKVCAGLTTITTVCHQSHTPIIRSGVAEKLYKNSIFSVLKEVIQPFRADAVLLEVCLAFTRTLAYLQFVLVDLSEFQDDLPGCWTEIYMQALKNPAIRSQFFDWAGLSKVISDFERGNRD